MLHLETPIFPIAKQHAEELRAIVPAMEDLLFSRVESIMSYVQSHTQKSLDVTVSASFEFSSTLTMILQNEIHARWLSFGEEIYQLTRVRYYSAQ